MGLGFRRGRSEALPASPPSLSREERRAAEVTAVAYAIFVTGVGWESETEG